LKNPTYKLIIRDLEFIQDEYAMLDPNLNPEKFFQKTEEARKRQKLKERNERAKKR